MTGPLQARQTIRHGPVSGGSGLESRRAWFIAAAAFVVGFVVFGIVYSFGVFLQPIMLDLQVGQAATSALFSTTGLAFYLVGPLTGHLGDRFGPRVMVGAGAALMGAGLILTSFIDRLWAGYLTYGALVGLGAACAYLPALSIVGGWFDQRRDTALGLAAAGTGCGTMLAPPLAAVLIEHIGWRPTLIVLGIGCLLLLAGCALTVRRPPETAASARRPFRRIVFSYEFATLYVSWVLATMALFVPFVFLPAFALRDGATQTAASALISVIGGMSIAGRVGIGWAGARFGVVALFKVAVLVMGASYVLWLIAGSYVWLVVFAVVLGLGYGIRIALVPSVLIEFFGLQNLGALLGVFFTATGVASLLGPLLAGHIVETSGDFLWGVAFALIMGLFGFLVILPLTAARPSIDMTPIDAASGTSQRSRYQAAAEGEQG